MTSLGEIKQQADNAAAVARQAWHQAQKSEGKYSAIVAELQRQAQVQQMLSDALSRVNVQAQRGDPNIQRIENIPGRRVPFDFVCEIAFAAGNASVQQNVITIDQSGPFIAVARSAVFLSQYQFATTDSSTGAVTILNGRSFGRQRPISSINDFNDGQPFSDVAMAVAFPGTGAPHIASPSNASPFRSMEMDFRINMREQGSGLSRMNTPLFSSMWVKPNGEAYPLGALDFFERSQVIQFEVQPLHVPNPEFGNISAFTGPNTEWPFSGSGWDAVEGINDTIVDDTEVTKDPITRLPNGVLQIGFHGYRIWQPPGPGQS